MDVLNNKYWIQFPLQQSPIFVIVADPFTIVGISLEQIITSWFNQVVQPIEPDLNKTSLLSQLINSILGPTPIIFEILYDKHKQGIVGVGVMVGVNVGVLLIGKQFKQLPWLEGPYSVVITTLSPPLMLSTIVWKIKHEDILFIVPP